MEMQEQPKWYILHTYSGYEAMVKDSLEKLIENNNLGDYITDLKIPMEQVIESGGTQASALLCVHQNDLHKPDLVLRYEYSRRYGFLRPAGASYPHESGRSAQNAS